MRLKHIRVSLTMCALFVLVRRPGGAQQNAGAPAINAEPTRDGSHDIDPLLGAWASHTKIRQHPLTGSNTWIEFEGVDVYRKLWGGRAIIGEYEGNSSTRHSESVMLYTYNPLTKQWSIYFVSSGDGKVTTPNAGEFKNGQGEFYTQDVLNGRIRYNRYIWSKLTTNSAHFEESWSDDGGKTWELDNITDMTRIAEDSVKPYVAPTAEEEGQHDFDFIFGDWHYHLKRRLDPLTGSTKWVDIEGTGHGIKLWNGRANLDEFEGDGATGHIEGLTLRTYNPQTHQWSLYWANSKDGKLVVPQVGQFKDGRGEFYAEDRLDGKSIFVRFIWTNTNTSMPHFEQAYSDDGGKTWEANWVTDSKRQ